jgi:hypothetical protein
MKSNMSKSVNYTSLSGLSATKLTERMPSLLPEVAQFSFTRYTPSLGLDERVMESASLQLQSELDRLRLDFPLLFERIAGLTALIAATEKDSVETISQMLRHDDTDESSHEFMIDAWELSSDGLAIPLSKLAPQQALGLSSLCMLKSGVTAHLPALDFHLPISQHSQKLVEQAARQLDLGHAAIVESGRSYHVYGLCTLKQYDWTRFMLRSLLLAPIIDSRYIAHRLLAGRSVLRINATLAKPIEPMVVAAF